MEAFKWNFYYDWIAILESIFNCSQILLQFYLKFEIKWFILKGLLLLLYNMYHKGYIIILNIAMFETV